MNRTDDGTGRYGLLASILFPLLCAAPFLGSAFHVDEPCFLAIARQLLRDPMHPLSFDYNWFGVAEPMSRLSQYTSLLPYLEALALRAAGGSEWAMRLLFLPFDALAAGSLYLLASRFLRRPLLPVLIVLASPGYLLGMRLLTAEKLVAAFGFCGLYALCRGLQDDDRRSYRASAPLLGLALLSKPSAIFLLVPTLWFQRRRGVSPGRMAGHLAAVLALPLLALAADLACGNPRIGRMSAQAGVALYSLLSEPAHALRSLLAFAGGGAAAPVLWPFFAGGKGRPWLPAAAFCALLFLPGFDRGPVQGHDRVLGFVFAGGALLLFWSLLRSREPGTTDLWLPWAASVALLQLAVYWSVVGRFMMFLIPPTVFGMSALLERKGRGRLLLPASLALLLPLSAALLWVDTRHADSQRELAALLASRPSGRGLWFTGHWGLQYYMESAGAKPLDRGIGGWAEVQKGDLVVVPAVNTNQIRPGGSILADVRKLRVDSAVPLRVLSNFGGQGGFYSNIFGFLPYSVSTEPLEVFTLVKPL
ncbi:MAG: glycosyltransferase family 39 protein [Elusimicrobiota bacterium]